MLNSSHQASGLVRTFFVFLDLPVHIEFAVSPMPIMSEGLVIDMDMVLRNPKDPRKTREVRGPHLIHHVKLTYKSSGRTSGFSQYVEFVPSDKQG